MRISDWSSYVCSSNLVNFETTTGVCSKGKVICFGKATDAPSALRYAVCCTCPNHRFTLVNAWNAATSSGLASKRVAITSKMHASAKVNLFTAKNECARDRKSVV